MKATPPMFAKLPSSLANNSSDHSERCQHLSWHGLEFCNEEYSCVIKDKKFVSTELDITIDGLMSPMKATRRDLLRPFTEIFKDGSDDKDDDP